MNSDLVVVTHPQAWPLWTEQTGAPDSQVPAIHLGVENSYASLMGTHVEGTEALCAVGRPWCAWVWEERVCAVCWNLCDILPGREGAPCTCQRHMPEPGVSFLEGRGHISF